MRHDMGKCVIERPRRGSSASSRKAKSFGRILLTEDGPEYFGETKLPMAMNGRAYGWDSKEFTDVLGPLKNYLRSSCGRPWNDVYSEIRKTLGHCGWAVEHIVRDHIDVAVNTWRGESGNIWVDDKHGVSGVGHRHYSHFYVEPETGILREAGKFRHWFGIDRPKPALKPATEIPISEGREYALIKGIWYEATFVMVEKVVMEKRWDGKEVGVKLIVKEWERRKRQLSKKNLRDLGLKSGQGFLPESRTI